jgi:dienelactone hydrolase
VKRLAAITVVTSAMAAAAFQPATVPGVDFTYDRTRRFDLTVEKTERRGGVTVQDVSYAQLDGTRNLAYLVAPSGPAGRPGILFVHWLEDPSPTSNRTEFIDESIELAAATGAVSLLPNAMWAVPGWFQTRNPANDYANSIRQINELRRALDLLAAQPGVDKRRLVLVGHDFGAMYGAVAAGLDPSRLTAFVFMAGTARFSDWFLLYPKVPAEARQQIVDRFAPLDPARYLAKLGAMPVLLQFGNRDRFVTRSAGDALIASVSGPTTSHFYDADHSLTSPSTVRADRIAWLKAQLAR